MSIDDQRDLHERLDGAVETIIPGPAPVDGVIRRGRVIRWRRRAVAVAAVAVVAAGAVAVPSLRHAAAQHQPATSHYTATVQAPGPYSPPGLIALGTVNGQRWALTAGRPGASGAGRGQQFVIASGPAFGPDGTTDSAPAFAAPTTEPVSFTGIVWGPSQAAYGPVAADVSYVTVRLGNGIVLTLHPVRVYGVRLVGFAIPVGAPVVSATAYSAQGEIATAIPFNQPGEMATFSAWLRPGQHGLSRASGRIASGVVSGHAWSVTAYLGPWGICVESSTGGGYCTTTASGLGTSLLFREQGTPGVAGGTASAAVTRVVAYPPGGMSVQMRPVTVGGQKFFAFPLTHADKAVRWKAYDRAGNVVASGTT